MIPPPARPSRRGGMVCVSREGHFISNNQNVGVEEARLRPWAGPAQVVG
jgi:hypothetical protein